MGGCFRYRLTNLVALKRVFQKNSSKKLFKQALQTVSTPLLLPGEYPAAIEQLNLWSIYSHHIIPAFGDGSIIDSVNRISVISF